MTREVGDRTSRTPVILGVAKWMYADDAATLYPDKSRRDCEAALDASSGIGRPRRRPELSRIARYEGDFVRSLGRRAKQRRLMVVEMYLRESGGVWRRSVFTGATVLEDGPSPYLDHSRPTGLSRSRR